MNRQKGLCLVELLMVIAILGFLSALLLPALIRAGRMAKGAVCKSNLKQWHCALALYAIDQGDMMPPEGRPNPVPGSETTGWYQALPPLVDQQAYGNQTWRTNPSVSLPKSLFLCPSNPRKSNGRNLFHYSLNQYLDGSGDSDAPTRLGSIESPSRMVWMFDSKNLPAVGRWTFAHTNLHGKGTQIAFLDGHVRQISNVSGKTFDSKTGISTDGEVRWIPGGTEN